MSITPSILDFVSKYDLKNEDRVKLFFLLNLALVVFACLALCFILRPRRFRDFPLAEKYEDLYGALVEGTRKVRISTPRIPGAKVCGLT